MSEIFYTSRSACEDYQKCPRKRYYKYLWNGVGLSQVYLNIPLATGSSVHKGPESLLRMVQHGIITKMEEAETYIDAAVENALADYDKMVKGSLGGLQVNKDENARFVYLQEKARVEGLIRAWAICELPQILKYYDVVSVEDEILMPLTPGIIFQAKIDAILKTKSTGDCFPYSLKTMKRYEEGRTDRTFNYALQTITEAMAAQFRINQINKTVGGFLNYAQASMWNMEKFGQLSSFVKKYVPSGEWKVRGTKHCFLVKGGKAKEDIGSEYGYLADGPLVKGYKAAKDTSGDVAYAHSWKYPNSNNRSGYSILGKGWEGFNVWEEMTVKEWIGLLDSKVRDHTGEDIYEMQPECGNILKKQVITPPETWINKEEMKITFSQLQKQENEVRDYGNDIENFPKNRYSCWYPTACEFTPMCHGVDWKGERVDSKVKTDPIGSGLFQIRVPHHKAEEKQVKEKVG